MFVSRCGGLFLFGQSTPLVSIGDIEKSDAYGVRPLCFSTAKLHKGNKIEIPNGIGTTSIKSSFESWVNQYFSSANFALELWNSMLLIKARSITINDYEFEYCYYS
ncbi:hypothetical protein HF838_15045 [Aneurinibacillus aneurinilyticus]|uniref:Uncharacterized protein n=1 Tax=Aneurinibacillus aneurinilyticus TaxID=1391 RepID=A0A848CVJ5_ANEAE|nr:hypothetical protein [Aneurinibacillus aneurinilyticus]NME99555.1 hypothetical protein [Aneurinibacillus aneurinilyticus]